MANVEEVTPTGPDTTRWRVKGPFGRTLEWEAQTTQKEQKSGRWFKSSIAHFRKAAFCRYIAGCIEGRELSRPSIHQRTTT